MTQSPPRSAKSIDASGPGPYRIQTAAELCGIPAPTLRAWERRYGVPVPRRTASAYRLYTLEDVELLRRMRDLVEQGVSPAEAARVVLASRAPISEHEAAPIDGLEVAQERIIGAMQRWDAQGIDVELTRLSMLLDAQTFYEKV